MRVAGVLGAIWIAAYATLMASGYDLAANHKEQIPASVRSSPGGYRSWSFWHSGSSGGK